MNIGYTETTEGDIPHHRHPSGFNAPVALVKFNYRETTPERDAQGRLVYVLPGGARFVPGAAP